MNPYKNEKLVKVGGTEILLRPTFQNCVSLETDLGYGLPQLSMNLVKSKMPMMTELSKVIYHCQASEPKLDQEQVWNLVMAEGVRLMGPVLMFVSTITAGDKVDAEKKNLSSNEATHLPR